MENFIRKFIAVDPANVPTRRQDAAAPYPERTSRPALPDERFDGLARRVPARTGMGNPKGLQPRTRRPGASLPDASVRGRPSPPAFSPSLEAKFGLEIEVPSLHVTTGAGGDALRRGFILLERPHWKLECDRVAAGRYDLEFVTEPLASETEVRAAIREITAMTATIRARALAGNMTVRLKDVAPDARTDAVLHLNDARMPGRLQSTYGVGLDHVATLIDELLTRRQADGIRLKTRSVADFYALRTGEPLPPRACSFVRLVVMYLERAQGTAYTEGTVHVLFRMMARSDFCAAFSKLLSPREQEAVRALFLAPQTPPVQVPMMMEALHMHDPGQRVFAKPYRHHDANPDHRQRGPSVKDWLASTMMGREEGTLFKDLLSPPAGYPLHSGDHSIDYGMGAMGVDERQGLLLFEIRGAPYRPHTVTMNGQLARAVDNELGRAGRFNPALETSRRGPVSSAKYDLLVDADDVYHGLDELAQVMRARIETLDTGTWKYILPNIEHYAARLAKTRETIAQRSTSSWAQPLAQTMDELQERVYEVLLSGREGRMPDLVAQLAPLERTLARYEEALWRAGAKRG
ncbi:hypothetical protein OVY01_02250 [Robbsia sp. Bb-Pol-6]|uniref:Uncharacterized protein n=1 Tax=Robbsia betulipollinis TaxID=2981849 RepID=A0ABT3ZHS8_9BURK|nr:hypothetical protein [Robbsia betulipollinis]MCY0386084.1 hypothetical protein [Robbsia betulipollinis]